MRTVQGKLNDTMFCIRKQAWMYYLNHVSELVVLRDINDRLLVAERDITLLRNSVRFQVTEFIWKK